MRYWSIGAMLGYAVLASGACFARAALNIATTTKTSNVIVLTIFGFIGLSSDTEFSS
jgi:hypothetical protein